VIRSWSFFLGQVAYAFDPFVEEAYGNGHKVEFPGSVIGGFEADIVAGEGLADVDFVSAPHHTAFVFDFADGPFARIVGVCGQALWKEAG